MFFSHLNTIISFIFTKNITEIFQVSQKIWIFTSLILTFLSIFWIFLPLIATKNNVSMYNIISAFFDLEWFYIGWLKIVLSYNNIGLVLLSIRRLRVHIDPPREITFRKPALEPYSWNKIIKTVPSRRTYNCAHVHTWVAVKKQLRYTWFCWKKSMRVFKSGATYNKQIKLFLDTKPFFIFIM